MTPERFLLKAAEQAGEMILGGWSPQGVSHTHKMDGTRVTETDVAISEWVKDSFLQEFPNGAFLCEESGYQSREGRTPVYLEDPLDGTTEYTKGGCEVVYGASMFCSDASLDPVATIVHAPLLLEPLTFTASLGRPAYCNGERIWVSNQKSGRRRIVVGTASGGPQPNELYDAVGFSAELESMGFIVEGMKSSIFSCMEVAQGRIHAVCFPWTKIHDMLGSAVVKAAGGVVSTLQGMPIDFRKDDQPGYIMANNEALCRTLVDVVSRHLRPHLV